MAYLPPELINEILLVLPVKSLLRFRCISKSFYAIINSKDFIYSHLHTSSQKRIHRKLIFRCRNYNKKHYGIHALDINGSVEEILLDSVLPDNRPLFVASYNGLVLLNTTDNKLAILNPSTRNYLELPAFPMNFTLVGNWKNRLGLGYDSTTDDYKVLLIIPAKPYCHVWIFELRSSCWRRIQDFPYIVVHKAGDGGGFVDGYMHFLCNGTREELHTIVAFDVAKETFSVVPQPSEFKGSYSKWLKVFEGCLCVQVYSPRKDDFLVDIYVWKKEGVDFTWIKLFSLLAELDNPITQGYLGYSKEGDKVLLFSFPYIYSYDLKEKSIEKIETSIVNKLDKFNYSFCLKSFVSVHS
ncbi:F-box protein CPR1-like [Euphorbia lathyris]|uniref:F-box protein CPR1-like n=1 Tax=Euphorbia lathyris TaxID=212925 RepID=UPI0033144035